MRSWNPENGSEERLGSCVELPEEKLVDYVMNVWGKRTGCGLRDMLRNAPTAQKSCANGSC
ncbi:hypothetical protein CM49_02250 [Paenibacillus sp. P1XP2]|nr:hypothetical protein CM49_02250 [Paenibacillus sp. P1XP2]